MIEQDSKILFDKFEIISCLKKDDYSSVFLADHIYLNKKIVLKILNKKAIKDESLVDRFKREAKILASLDHPNIIKVLDFGLYEDFLYISFEYFESENLRFYINNQLFDETEKFSLLKQLFSALHFAHSNDIVHRDIKPENIFVNKSGKLKIGDFGLAYSSSDNFVTHKTTVVGTPAYMSPEQIQGENVTEQSDLFSAGILIYELYTGTNLFAAGDLNQTINNILNFDFENAVENLNVTDEKLKKTIAGLMQPNMSARYKSALDVLEDLGVSVESPEEVVYKPMAVKKKANFIGGGIIIAIGITVSVVLYMDFSKPSEINTKIGEATGETQSVIQESNPDFEPTQKAADEQKSENAEIKEEPKTSPLESDQAVNQRKNDENYTADNEDISYGFLTINCFPWAYVFIDSVKIDSTPIDENIELTAGNHMLWLKNPLYPEYRENFTINAGQEKSLSYMLDTLFSFIDISVHPWGRVLINGTDYGDTPFNSLIILSPGTQTIEIKNPELGEFSKEIYTVKNDTIRISYNMVNKKFSIK